MADSGFPSLSSSVDVSSYKQPQATSFVDSLKGWQGVESNKLTIDKQKLDLVNQNYGHLIRELTSLGPNPTPEQLQQAGTNAVKMKLVTPEMFSTFIGQIPTDPAKIPQFMEQTIGKLLSTQEAVNYHLGEKGFTNQGQQLQPTLTSPKPSFGGVRPNGSPIQLQVPPTAERVDDNPNSPTYGQKGYVGPIAPQIPQGRLPVTGPNALPGQFQDAPAPNIVRTEAIRPKLPVAPLAAPPAPSAAPNPVAVPPIDNRPASIAERIAPVGQTGLIPTGLPPGVGEARKLEAEGGAQALNADRVATTTKLQGLVPLKQALALLPGLTTGIGTEPYNKARSAFINLGIIPANVTDPAVIYQEVNKKLSQYVQQSGLAQRSDAAQALSQASSPNVSSQLNPAIIKLARDAISQDRSEALRALSFEGNPENYNKHRVSFPQTIDQRALHIDVLPPNERDALLNEMKKKKDTKEGQKFWKTLDMATQHNLLD